MPTKLFVFSVRLISNSDKTNTDHNYVYMTFSYTDSPIAVSGIANIVFSVATLNIPCTDKPTPCEWKKN